MGKKRKASGHTTRYGDHAPKAESSKLLINSYEDVADSEDEFLGNRDRILLDEGRDVKKRRKIEEQDALLEASDEEVFDVPESDEDEEDDEDDDGADDFEREVYGDASEEEQSGKKNAEEEEEEEGWGDIKQDYYGADVIDTEQAALDEEAEAKRLQKKQLEAMAGADMLFGAEDEEDEDEDRDMEDDIVTERLPELEVPENLSAEERLKLLKLRYPELDAISKDWLRLHKLREQAEQDASHVPEILKLRAIMHPERDAAATHIATTRFSVLSAYLGACAMYFAVLTSTASDSGNTLALPPRKLREHPVIQNVLEARQMWAEIEHLERVDTAAELADLQARVKQATKEARRKEELATGPLVVIEPKNIKEKKVKKDKADRVAEAQAAMSEARRAARMAKIEADLADLDTLATASVKKPKTSKAGKLIINEEDSDIGDEATLTEAELRAKAARKKSLKFYTSQIAQKSNKQGARSRDFGGDVDVPHRERLRDREARLNAAAEKRGRQALQPGEELGGDDSADEGAARGEDDEDGYYDMVARKSKQKKVDKKEKAEAYEQAKREGAQVFEVETVGEDGKRKISYQIKKNKGLTPFRKKEVRNPRVKKKLKYAEKLKKLGSTKQIYKGGEKRGGYGGELSGIKTGLVKSVKL